MSTLASSFVSFVRLAAAFGIRDAITSAIEMIVGVSAAVVFKSRRTTMSEREERSSACKMCPIYDGVFKTCGTPGKLTNSKDDTVGCWCPITLASFVKKKECWLSTRGRGRWKS